MPINVGRFYARLICKDKDAYEFGILPLMASCCDGQIGALNAESFAERDNSVAKLILTTLNANLSDEDLEKLVVLRMNRNFMSYMRKHYFNEIKALQPFNMTVI